MLQVKNAFVEYIDEDSFFTDLFKHAGHMSIAAGYKANYKSNGQRINDDDVIRHQFWNSETREPMFDLYEAVNAETTVHKGEKYIERSCEHIIQVVIAPNALKKHPHVKEDLELLCSRVFRKNPDWIMVEEAPIPVEKEKPGCLGVLYGLLQS